MKSPDGLQFNTKQELRNYMMSQYYSFRNHNNVSSNSPLMKAPGDIDGQVFEISDCTNSSLVVMDYTEQVQIDNLDNCRVFIGACSSVIYVRNCKKCSFYTCSKQLRLREVSDSVFHVFTQSQIHIELSQGVRFGPFLGGYTEQKNHFERAGFDVHANMWYDVYDHNDSQKSGSNWSLLAPTEKLYHEAWFPVGECETFIPLNEPSTQATKESGQTGESYGLDHMIADDLKRKNSGNLNQAISEESYASRKANNSMNESTSFSKGLNMETALLVAYSLGKGININVWMSEELYENGNVPVPEFNRKLISLANMVGMNQDEETKQELDLAVSKSSLQNIQNICGVENVKGSGHLTHVNVSLFVKLCQEKMDDFMKKMDTEADESSTSEHQIEKESIHRSSADSSEPQPRNPLKIESNRSDRQISENPTRQSNNFFSDYFAEGDLQPVSASIEKNIFEMTDEEYIQDLKSKRYIYDGNNNSRPQSAPAGRGRLVGDREDIQQFLSPSLTKGFSSVGKVSASQINLPSGGTRSTHFIEATESFDLSGSERVDRNMSNSSDAVSSNNFRDRDDGISPEEDDDEALDRDAAEYLMSRKGRSSSSTRTISSQTAITQKKTKNDAMRQIFTSSSSTSSRKSPTRVSASRNKSLNSSHDKDELANRSESSESVPLLMSKSVSAVSSSLRENNSRSKSAPRRHSFSAPRSREPSRTQQGANEGKRKSTEEKIEDLKDLVEDLVRNTVKKADHYHMIQVHLGYIESYTLVPPRGAIVASRSRQWLTPRELQTAFLAGRLILTEPQVLVLRNLVRRFAATVEAKQNLSSVGAQANIRDSNTAFSARAQEASTAAGESNESKAAGVVNQDRADEVLGPHQTLSSEWLKRYLLHLRLTKRRQSATGSKGKAALNQEAQRQQQLDWAMSSAEYKPILMSRKPVPDNTISFSAVRMPLSFHEWLGGKFSNKIQKEKLKPKEFDRLLSGKPHHLSKDEIEKMLAANGKYSILSKDQLLEEISYRVDSWILDISGRRDFQHAFNISLHRRLRQTETIWDKLSLEEQRNMKFEVTNIVLKEKREELLSAERTSAMITKDLYFKFQESLKDRTQKFSSWLNDHLDKFKKSIEDFRKKTEESAKAAAHENLGKTAVAGLNDVETQLKEVAKSLDSKHAVELEKGIVALRKSAASKGIAQGKVVTKEDFDKHIKAVLVPRTKKGGNFDVDVVQLQSHPGGARDGSSGPVWTTQNAALGTNLAELFRLNLDEAVQKVLDIDREKREKAAKEFNDWLAEKKKQNEILKQRQQLKIERETKLKESREKKARIAYRKWLNLRKQNKYKSMVDQKAHELPTNRSVDHPGRWYVDRDPAH